MLPRVIRCLLAITLLAAMGGCANVTLVDSWRDPGFSAKRYQKFIVVNVTGKVLQRQVVEDILAAELRQQGVAAVASHTLMETKGRASQEEIQEAVSQAGSDAIITTRLVKLVKRVEVYPGLPPAGCYYPGYYRAYPYPYDFYGYYGCALPYEPGGTRTLDEAVMETNLYDAATNRMIWSATTSTYDSQSPQNDAAELAGTIIFELRREGFI
jgi:hypothetical protein